MLALGKKIVHDLNHAMKGASWVPNIISSLPPRGMNGQHQRHTFMPKLICHWRAGIAPAIRPAWQKGAHGSRQHAGNNSGKQGHHDQLLMFRMYQVQRFDNYILNV
jgi:hypothetical protein